MIPRSLRRRLVGRPPPTWEVLCEGLTEAHVHTAFDLARALQWVDRPADVVRSDDALDAPVVVEDDHLGRVAEGEVRDRLVARRARRDREVADVLAEELPSFEVREAVLLEGLGELLRRRAGRRPRQAVALEAVVMPHSTSGSAERAHADTPGLEAGLVTDDLARDRVHALAHLGEAGERLDRAVLRQRAAEPARCRPCRCRCRSS